MKNIFFIILLVVAGATTAQSQDFVRFASTEIKTEEEAKAAEGDALAAANYILSTPVADTPERKASIKFIITWMTATSHTFEIGKTESNFFEKDQDILGLIMSAMAKTALENPGLESKPAEFKLKSYQTLLDFCADDKNNVKQTKELKKAIKANKEGKLKEYLGL